MNAFTRRKCQMFEEVDLVISTMNIAQWIHVLKYHTPPHKYV